MFALEVINAINAEGAPQLPVRRRLKGDSKTPYRRVQYVHVPPDGLLVVDLGTTKYEDRLENQVNKRALCGERVWRKSGHRC